MLFSTNLVFIVIVKQMVGDFINLQPTLTHWDILTYIINGLLCPS